MYLSLKNENCNGKGRYQPYWQYKKKCCQHPKTRYRMLFHHLKSPYELRHHNCTRKLPFLFFTVVVAGNAIPEIVTVVPVEVELEGGGVLFDLEQEVRDIAITEAIKRTK